MKNVSNGTACIRHQCRKTAVLSCHRFLITFEQNHFIEQKIYIAVDYCQGFTLVDH